MIALDNPISIQKTCVLSLYVILFSQVDGIQGIMMAYTSALFNVSLAGPTLFGPVISSAAQIASQSLINGRQKYYVLLIITVRNEL